VKIKDLEERIAERAHENVNNKIAIFQAAVDKALKDLFGSGKTGLDRFGYYGSSVEKMAEVEQAKLAALQLAICNSQPKPNGASALLPWPRMLWDKEADAIRDELLAKMDLMQSLLTSQRKRDTSTDLQPDMKE